MLHNLLKNIYGYMYTQVFAAAAISASGIILVFRVPGRKRLVY